MADEALGKDERKGKEDQLVGKGVVGRRGNKEG